MKCSILFAVIAFSFCSSIKAQPFLYVENPEYHGHSTSFDCLSVRLTANKTILTHRFKASNGSNGFWVNKGCYLQTFDSSRKYNLLYIKNASYDKYSMKKISTTSDFTQVFEPLPANCTRFKYYEPDGSFETYDLNSYTGRKFVYSNGSESYSFKNVCNAFSSFISTNSNVFKIATEKNTFMSKIQGVELSLNYPYLTFLCRMVDNSYPWAIEFRFNINDTHIDHAIGKNESFYVINCESGIIYNHLHTYNYCEDNITTSNENCRSMIFYSELPLLNNRLGNALLAILKSARNQNINVSTDFNSPPSGMSFNKVYIGGASSQTTNKKNIKKGDIKGSTKSRIPTLKKTK